MKLHWFDETKLLKILPIIFLVVLSFKIIYTYQSISKQENDLATNNSKIILKLIGEYTKYYQNHFTNIMKLDQNNFSLFPSFSNSVIFEKFSLSNNLDIEIKTVSVNPMNPKNLANSYEKKVIEEFQNNFKKSEYFDILEKNDTKIYYHASVLRINQSCLKCHSSKSDAPSFVALNYNSGYGYSNGDAGGIISIKSSSKSIQKSIVTSIIISLIYDILIMAILFVLIQYFLRHIKHSRNILQHRLKLKKRNIEKRIGELRSFKYALDESIIVSKMDLNGVITTANQKLCEVSGFLKEELVGKNHRIIIHPDMDEFFFKDMWDEILAKKSWTKVLKWQKKDKTDYYTQTTITPILNEKQQIKEFIVIQDNVSEFIRQKERIQRILLTEKLTKLPNRTKLLDDIEKSRNPQLAITNIDKFREVNDFYGFKVGDDLIWQISNVLRMELQDLDKTTLYKLSSDEFAILQDGGDFNKFIDLMRVCTQKVESKIYKITSQSISITISTGISKSKYDILATAGMALYRAKTSKQTFVIYQSNMNLEQNINRNMKGVIKIKFAIKYDKILTYFQPLYHIKNRKIEKYETLIRLNDDGVILSPYHFLDIAKRAKLYPQLTRIVIEKSFEKFKDSHLGFSINISIDDVLDKETVKFIKQKLTLFPNPHLVVFEILESEGFDSYDDMENFIIDIKKFGSKVAIDDFGSGYSNFSHILNLKVDYLKIDASLIKNMLTDKNSKILVESIVNFSKVLNIQTIAEYVESKDILDALEVLGVDYAQGYYIGKPEKELI